MSEPNRPWTWKIPESHERVKKDITRQDALDRVSGHAAFTRDISLPGMLCAKILTSPYAHAKIVSMDTGRAEALVGVRDILRYDDPDIAQENGNGADTAYYYNILALPGISDFYQHPMGVAVVADSEETCDRALDLIEIEWEERPFILEMEESAKPDAPKIMTEVVRQSRGAKEPNIVMTDKQEIGDVDAGFAEADTLVEYTIKRAMNSPVGAEAMICVAQWHGDFLDLWVHDQGIPQGTLSSNPVLAGQYVPSRGARPSLAFAHWSKIRVQYPYQGSGFGGIAWLAYSSLFIRIAAILAKRANGMPVKLQYDESSFYCGGDEAGVYTCKVGTKKNGKITAYHWHMAGVRNPAIDKTYECTAIPNIRGTQAWSLINRGHQACFRHGAASCVPHSVMFDQVAAACNLDPTEVALKNDGCHGHDWDWVTNYQKENGFPQRQSLKEVIEKGKKAIDWDRKWHGPGKKKLANGKMHGLGFMSINQWFCGAGAMSIFPTYACLFLKDGKVTIVGSRCDMGGDAESAFRQCVASELGLKYEDTILQERGSDNGAFYLAQPSGSSGTVNATHQLILAARELKRQILESAAAAQPGPGFPGPGFMSGPGSPFVNRKPEDLDIRDSMIVDKANPDKRMPLRQIGGGFMDDRSFISHPKTRSQIMIPMFGSRDNQPLIMARQAHFIEVEVDTETGMVEVIQIVCVNDIGHLFNPQGAMGQQYGGAIMGLGRSATEEKIYCPKTGVGLNFDLINYHLGTMNDYPSIDCILHESHLGYAPYGAYGIGENIGASLSAITSSGIYNAIGKWVLDFPITPDKVLKALGKA
jgi:CO/xanthine dehydrogenase Mo-binding subunit